MEHRHGIIAEFESADTLLDGLRRLRAAGFRTLEVYSPYPVDGVDDLVGRRRGALALVIVAAGVAGGLAGFFLQYYGLAVDYPLNIGGRPLNSWPAFSTTTFEMAALSMIVVGTLAFLWSCRLPRLYDPIFAIPGMERASQDRFLVRVAVRDGIGDRDRLDALLGSRIVGEVP